MMIGSSAVIDASFTFKTVVPNPLQERHRSVIRTLMGDGSQLVAPTLWTYETTSALTKAVYFEQLTLGDAQQALRDAAALGVRLVPPDDSRTLRALDWTVRLRRVAAYDSFYLALAEATECDLWTGDRRLRNAVNLPWIRMVDDDA